MIAVIELPTPRIIKRKIKKFYTRERAGMYALILGGIVIVCINAVPFKIIPISALLYCGVAYEVVENSNFIIEDPRVIQSILESYNNMSYL
ncbi:hypothetical protein [uncultured Clostridium sp.]|jgi:hypothetical protein|uniref:hypothetical protein n=1 Tax=uncultured Clostridium sp. TaxID=59620 RepID=UPI00261A96C5|nr:hypothetical protein [uncultured Clostridium sp.]